MPLLGEITDLGAGWPLALSMAAAVSARGLLAGRRRTALNEALHELRRPLQAVALGSGRPGQEAAVDWSLQMAAAALERLEREINGERIEVERRALDLEELLAAAVARWGGRAALAGGSLRLGREAGAGVTISADRAGLAQALDNLIVNAIEHGGPRVLLAASRLSGAVRISVEDSGRDSRPPSRRETPAELIARLSGRRRRGHGLRVVRRVAAAHGGEFELRTAGSGTAAVMVLPLVAGDGQ